jgi:hypothetical protein
MHAVRHRGSHTAMPLNLVAGNFCKSPSRAGHGRRVPVAFVPADQVCPLVSAYIALSIAIGWLEVTTAPKFLLASSGSALAWTFTRLFAGTA